MSSLPIIFGTGQYGTYDGSNFDSGSKVQETLMLLQKDGISRIDTARQYPSQNSGTCEQVLGQADLSSFTLDTKVWSMPGRHTPTELQKSVDESLQALGVSKVNVLYLHFPDFDTPLQDVCQGMNNLHVQGKFQEFGVSNFTIPQIRTMLEICDTNNYVKPTVYQGQYNALARNAEANLIPFLHAHGMSFYAYSAAAGGAFNSTSTRLASEGKMGELWRRLYGSPAASDTIASITEGASRHGLTGHATALSWVLNHSALSAKHGDAVIVSARTVEQLQQTLDACKTGPLPQELEQLIERAWDSVKDTAPPYSTFFGDKE